MKKSLIFLVFTLIFAAAFCFSACAAGAPSLCVNVSAGGENVKLSPAGGVFYLPSSADVTKLSLAFEGELSYKNADGSYSGTLAQGQTLDLTRAAGTDERGVPCYKLTLANGAESADFTFYSAGSLASVFVSTSKGLSYIESSKDNRDKSAKITVVNESGAIEYSDTAAGTASEIKGRGNATFGYYKKPYQIKLSEKTALLGMDKAKTWILLANYTDQSMLHNALGFELGDALGVPFNIEYNFANLYIDGEYRGLYMICEKVQIDSARVDIADLEKATEKANEGTELGDLPISKMKDGYLIRSTIISEYSYVNNIKNPADITGGYLVELDNNYGTREPCYFKTENGNVYVVKSPEYASRAQVEYIAKLFAEMEEAIYSETGYNKAGKHFSEYMDMESFAAVYTVQELMKNWDAYTSSMFFFKDADKDGVTAKIYMGPLWDLDNTLGNINFNHDYGIDTSYLWAQNGVFQNVVRTFAKNLMKHYEFQAVNAQVYAEAYGFAENCLASGGWFEETSEKIYASVLMDRTRWETYDSERWLLNSAERKVNVKFVQFAEYGKHDDEEADTALGFMRRYLSERADALLESIGKITAEKPPENTSASTGTTLASTAAGTTSAPGGADTQGSSSGAAAAVCAVLASGAAILALALIFKKKKR